jgi:surface antigen
MRDEMTGLKPIVVALLALGLSLGLASCVTDTGPVTTASIPYAATTSNSGVKVASSGVLGNGLGSNLDDKDRQRAYAAEVQALEQGEPGEPVGWKGTGGNRHGTIVPGGYYETRGVRCRDYSHTIYVNGRPETARATACRNPDGSWQPVG